MGIPNKNNPNSPEYATQLQVLNQFTDFISNLDLRASMKLDALKVVNCLKFIKINLEFIGYAVEHPDDSNIYTHIAATATHRSDIEKGVIRDFNDTAMHFNSYHSKKQVKEALENLVTQFENAIIAMQEKEKLVEFAQKLQFDGDIGCIEQRTAAALSFAATYLSSSLQNLDDLMGQCQFTAEDDETDMLKKAKTIFEPLIGQACIWNNAEHLINKTLIRQYLTEVFAAEFTISAELLDELEDKNASQYCFELIEKIDPSELNQSLLNQDRGFELLQNVILHQPPNVCLAFINKISLEAFKTLFHGKCSNSEKMQCLKSVLQIQSLEVCLTLLEKIDGIENVKFTFKDKLSIFWKHFCEHIKQTTSFEASTLFKLIVYLIAITLFVTFPQIALIVTAIVTMLSLCVVPILVIADFINFTTNIVVDFFRGVRSATIQTNNETNLYGNLLNDLLALQSPKLLALFLNKLSPEHKQITSPLELLREKKSLPYFLFAPDCDPSLVSTDAYYSYLCANQALKNDLIANRHFLLTSCIDYYFEGKPGKLHPKLIYLFEECLNKKLKLSVKEQAFLRALKKETISSPDITANEVWCAGVDSWNHYRYLRQKNDPAIKVVLDELLLTDRLFQGDTQSFNKDSNSEIAKEKQSFEEAHTCIRANKGLAKTVQAKNYKVFMQQLEDLNHRPALRQTVHGANKKFVHLTGEVVDYTKKRRQKPVYTHTKKTSTTLLSNQLNTPLFNEVTGFLFHQDQCKVKARLHQSSLTFSHGWLGNERQVNQYKSTMQRINETDERKFVTNVKNNNWTNEVLAQLNKDALRAVIVTKDTPEALNLALSRRNDVRNKFSLYLPIIFYNDSQRSIKHYRLREKNSLAKKLMLEVYRFCLEKQDWKPGFFASNARTESKLTPKTVSFIKALVEDCKPPKVTPVFK